MLRFASLALAAALVVALALPRGMALGEPRQLPENGNRWGRGLTSRARRR